MKNTKWVYIFIVALIVSCAGPIDQAPVVSPSPAPIASPIPTSSPSPSPDPTPIASPDPTPVPTTSPAQVKTTISVLNSEWKIVKQDIIISGSRDIQDDSAIIEEVSTYNANHISDQWFIVEGEVPDIADSPPCNIFIVDKITHEVIKMPDGNGGTYELKHENWPRKQYVDNKAGWERDAVSANADLYVDVIPPPPAPLTADQIYAKYSIYIVNNIGAIKYERHCDTVPPEFAPYTPDQYYYAMNQWFQLIIQNDSQTEPDAPWRMIEHKVYIAP